MRTPFHDIHQAQGARLTEYQGWELPDQFTDPVKEYQAVRASVGVLDVSYRATFRLSGPDRAEFLHRILSGDIKNLSPGVGRHAALLTVQGKLCSVMKVLATDDTILLETEPAARPALFDRLEMYKLAQKVELEDATEAFAKLLVQGPDSSRLLRAVVHQELALHEELQHQEYPMAEGGMSAWAHGRSAIVSPSPIHPHAPTFTPPLRLIRVHETGELGYELMAPAAQASELWARLSQAGAAFGLKPVGFQAFNMLRVEAGIPWYGVDMDETTFPQEAGVEHVLDWHKGCYVGQEPVARIKFRGHVNKKLTGLRFPEGTQPEPGNKVIKGSREIGRVTSAVYSPHLNCPIALGYVRREFLEVGTEVTVETARGPTPAVVAALPFYSGSALAA